MSLRREKEQKYLAKERFTNLFNRIFSGLFATIVLSTHILPLSVIADEKTGIESNDVTPLLKLDTSNARVISSTKTKSEFVIGESRSNRELRLKAEDAARAKVAEQKRLEETKRETVSRELRAYSPEEFNSIYESAGAMFGINPKLLQAVHIVETGASGSTRKTSYAGATGPMQFLPSTWRRHGVDGDGDGHADITNVADAIYTAASYLKSCGYPDTRKALWGYNPSTSYYNKVMNTASRLGM